MYPKYQNNYNDRERGQATIALVGVVAVGCLAAVAISIIAQAMVHRAHARNAADAVALAVAADPASAQVLHDWYGDRGITIEQEGERTIARSGPSQAASWASSTLSARQPAPALVAIIARAEQLLETTLAPVRWSGIAVTLSSSDAGRLRDVAADLGLCEIEGQNNGEDGAATFELC